MFWVTTLKTCKRHTVVSNTATVWCLCQKELFGKQWTLIVWKFYNDSHWIEEEEKKKHYCVLSETGHTQKVTTSKTIPIKPFCEKTSGRDWTYDQSDDNNENLVFHGLFATCFCYFTSDKLVQIYSGDLESLPKTKLLYFFAWDGNIWKNYSYQAKCWLFFNNLCTNLKLVKYYTGCLRIQNMSFVLLN